jgi:hypothetical protein
MASVCAFTYTSFVLAFVYLILLALVMRYLHNIIEQNSTKKKAQKIFLAILIGHTLRQSPTHEPLARRCDDALCSSCRPTTHTADRCFVVSVFSVRVLYFIVFPFSSSACNPRMKGTPGIDTTRSADWWMHLLGNLPAMLFLMAFSVLVYTFARIYHKVLLAGVYFQERRFNALTVLLIVLNALALIATFGDWAYAASNKNSTLEPFVTMLIYCVTGVSAILALMFLVYGALLYYQVQNIIRASAENVSSDSFVTTAAPRVRGSGAGAGRQETSFANGGQQHSNHIAAYPPPMGGNRAVPNNSFGHAPDLASSNSARSILPNGSFFGGGNSMAAPLLMPHMGEAGTGFTPQSRANYQQRWDRSHAQGERADADPSEAGEPDSAGISLDASYDDRSNYTAQTARGPVGVNNGGVAQTPPISNAHFSLGAYTHASPTLPIQRTAAAGVGAGPDVQVAHSYNTSVAASFNTTAGPAPPSVRGGGDEGNKKDGSAANNGGQYAASVSPEYSTLPNSTKARQQPHRGAQVSPSGMTGTGTPTDQLVGGVSHSPAGAGSRKTGVCSLSSRAGAPSAIMTSRPQLPSVHPPRRDDPSAGGDSQAHEQEPSRGEGQPHWGAGGYNSLAEGGVYPDVVASGGGARRGSKSVQHQQLLPSASAGSEYVRDRGDVYTSLGGNVSMASNMDEGMLATPTAPPPPPNPMAKIAVVSGIMHSQRTEADRKNYCALIETPPCIFRRVCFFLCSDCWHLRCVFGDSFRLDHRNVGNRL